MPPELGGKSGMECFNTRFPLPTLLCAGYSVKLIDFLLALVARQSASLLNQYLEVLYVEKIDGK